MKNLTDFAHAVLEILETEPEWGADTMDRIAEEAIQRGLASTHPKTGMFQRRKLRPQHEHHLLKVIGDVEPELEGPFTTVRQVMTAARAHRRSDPEMTDGLFPITITAGATIEVNAFAGGDFP